MKTNRIEWEVEVVKGKKVELISKATREEARRVKNRAKRNGKFARIIRKEYELSSSKVIR